MKAYSVKQLAEMLSTNPETVRRWIRDGKLQAIQISRKDGNQVSEDALKKFLETSPKYLSKIGAATVVSPALGIATLAGGLVATALISYYSTQKQTAIRIKADDFKVFLAANQEKVKETISRKEALIRQTENEIVELQRQFEQYQYLLEHDDLVEKTIQLTESQKVNKEDD